MGYGVAELQTEFVNLMRKSHRIDGLGAPAVPQWEVWERVATLYADVACTDDGEPYWNFPLDLGSTGNFIPALAVEVVHAMGALGFFTHRGVAITSDIWAEVHFTKDTISVLEQIGVKVGLKGYARGLLAVT